MSLTSILRARLPLVLSFVALPLALGCEGRARPPAPDRAPAAGAAGDAMCEEHGVLEVLCTKCNPQLVPVFQAMGDLCEEHGFPESVCPICHPERHGRPVAGGAEAADDSPSDGTKVRLATPETARLAGLETAAVVQRATSPGVVAVARIVYDATRVAEVNARSAGVVRAVLAEVGARVTARSPLATLESAGVGADQSRLVGARARLEVAQANHARERELRDRGITSDRDVLAARQELAAAQAEVASAQAALGMIGATGGGAGRYTVSSPRDGVVTRRLAAVGRLVGVEETLFEIVDTSTMWAEIDVPEADLHLVSVGQSVTLTVDGVPGRERAGTILYLAPEVDPRTRTVVARAALDNADGALRANMFATARISLGGPQGVLLVPRSAVQRARSVQLVFARLDESLYEARRVRVGPPDGDLVEVEGRLAPSDRVVTTGSFLLKTETLRESIGAGCCAVEASP